MDLLGHGQPQTPESLNMTMCQQFHLLEHGQRLSCWVPALLTTAVRVTSLPEIVLVMVLLKG